MKLSFLALLAFALANAQTLLHFTQDTQDLFEKGTNSVHYGDPTTGCMVDEVCLDVAVSILDSANAVNDNRSQSGYKEYEVEFAPRIVPI